MGVGEEGLGVGGDGEGGDCVGVAGHPIRDRFLPDVVDQDITVDSPRV